MKAYATFSLYIHEDQPHPGNPRYRLATRFDYVMTVGTDENGIDALMYEANRLAGLGHTVEVRPCL